MSHSVASCRIQSHPVASSASKSNGNIRAVAGSIDAAMAALYVCKDELHKRCPDLIQYFNTSNGHPPTAMAWVSVRDGNDNLMSYPRIGAEVCKDDWSDYNDEILSRLPITVLNRDNKVPPHLTTRRIELVIYVVYTELRYDLRVYQTLQFSNKGTLKTNPAIADSVPLSDPNCFSWLQSVGQFFLSLA